jgi:hypothetical protein
MTLIAVISAIFFSQGIWIMMSYFQMLAMAWYLGAFVPNQVPIMDYSLANLYYIGPKGYINEFLDVKHLVSVLRIDKEMLPEEYNKIGFYYLSVFLNHLGLFLFISTIMFIHLVFAGIYWIIQLCKK